MASKAAIPIILGLGVGTLALILLTRKAEAVPPELEIPTVDDIMAARSPTELRAYYNLIGQLLTLGKISWDNYQELYRAYHERWYQLRAGGAK